MKPQMPSRPCAGGLFERISAEWIAKLHDCVRYCLDNMPRGDGVTILNQSGGMLRAVRQSASGGSDSGNSQYAGPFTVSVGTAEADGATVPAVIVTGGHTDLGDVTGNTVLRFSSNSCPEVVIYATAEALSPVVAFYGNMPENAMYYTLAKLGNSDSVTRRHYGDVYFGARYVLDSMVGS